MSQQKIHIKMKPMITSDYMKSIHKYIFDNRLQDEYDKKNIIPDNELQSQLNPLNTGDKSYTYYNLKNYLKKGY